MPTCLPYTPIVPTAKRMIKSAPHKVHKNERLHVLDGFRFIAITLVVFYHYLSRFAPPEFQSNLYPYSYSKFFLFKYGYLGVQFFFIISGFVIFLTLEKCSSLKEFYLKRLIRLFPTILICSVLTYVIIKLSALPGTFQIFHTMSYDFLPSLTFTEPLLWKYILSNNSINYIDGSYWSLATEVKFYFIAGVIFFINKEKFIQNWMKFVTLVFAMEIILNFAADKAPDFKIIFDVLFFPHYIIFFTMGIFFYGLYTGKILPVSYKIPLYLLTTLILFYSLNLVEISFTIAFIILFYIFVYKERWLHFLSSRFVSFFGIISYPLYLLHQRIGVILIWTFAFFLHLDYLAKLILIPVIALMIIISNLINKYVELPANTILRKILF